MVDAMTGDIMTAARELFITGLKNAHAMERQAQEMLERQAQRMVDYPQLREKAHEHLLETREQMKRLETCLQQLGSSPSALKDTALALGANMAAIGHAMASDEVLKNTFASNGLEHFEIAAYKSLLTMADRAGIAVRSTLEQSLREEERMAEWVDKHVEALTLQYMQNEERAAA
jgi:ferritin-like metal-binding protein YciE